MLNHQELKKYNPQRYPIALIDRVIKLELGEQITAIKAVTATESCYRHIDADADISAMAYPTSLITESFCQAAGPLCAKSGMDFISRVMLFVSMNGVVFHQPVFPGDVMTHTVRITKLLSSSVVLCGEVHVGSDLVAEFDQIVVTAKEKLDSD